MDLLNKEFNSWKVIGGSISTSKGERKWLCRCQCGTERYVLERSLLSGGSRSCGCLRQEQLRKAIACQIEPDMVFGELKVIQKAEHQRKNGGIWWTCECSCGNIYDAPATLLVKSRRTHCGSKEHPRRYATVDIREKRFRQLVAKYPLPRRSRSGSVIWHCICDCGNEVDLSYNELVYSNVISCGCQKARHTALLPTFLTHVGDTSLEMLKSKKIPANNTTGVKGVYQVNGKHIAKIVFQKKQYQLGTYDTVAEAAKARQDAEKSIFAAATSFYEKWKIQAEEDPRWAQSNPVQFEVRKEPQNRLTLICLPALE